MAVKEGEGEGVLQRGLLRSIEERFKLGRRIGQGRKGVEVFKCTELSTGLQFACKRIDKCTLTEARKAEAMRAEVSVMQRLAGHPNIVVFRDCAEDAQVSGREGWRVARSHVLQWSWGLIRV